MVKSKTIYDIVNHQGTTLIVHHVISEKHGKINSTKNVNNLAQFVAMSY